MYKNGLNGAGQITNFEHTKINYYTNSDYWFYNTHQARSQNI